MMQDDNSDTSPDAHMLQVVHDELIALRKRFGSFENRLFRLERDVNSLKLSIELIQNQYQENGSAIANLNQVCYRHGEMISQLLSMIGQSPPTDENGGIDERGRTKT